MGYLYDNNQRLGKRGIYYQNATGEDVLNQPPASPSFLPQQAQTADPFGSQDTIQTLIGLQGIKPEPDILPAQDRPEPMSSPFANPVLGETPTPVQPKAGLYDEWKVPVGGTGLPLDKFVQLTGMAAHALDPKGFGGILGKNVAAMGAQAEQGRLGYEERQAAVAQKEKQYQDQKALLLQQHKESRAANAAVIGEKLVGNKNASLSQKQAGMEMVSGYVKMIMPDIAIPAFNAEEDGALAKKISSIAQDTSLNKEQKRESVLDETYKAGKIDEENYVKLRFPETVTKKVENYVGQDGGVVPIDMNSPTDQGRVVREGLTPYEKPTVGQGAPHTTTQTSPDGKQERTLLWDAAKNDYFPLSGEAGSWHPAKSQVTNINLAANQAGVVRFKDMPEPEKENAYKNFILNKVTPSFGMGQNPDRPAWNSGLNSWMVANNITPEDVATGRAAVKFQSMSGTLQNKAILTTVDPLLDALTTAGKALGNSQIPGWNYLKNTFAEATGKPEIVAFRNLRDDTIAEVERGLLNTGVLSDTKYIRAAKNVADAQSIPQLNAAVSNMRIVIHARLDSIAKMSMPPSNLQSGGAKATHQYIPGRGIVEIQ